MGDPFFCKYLCPQGVLEGAIPLSLAHSGIRAALGHLFTFKFTILVLIIILSILFYRPFCKWICPLGAVYSLFNRVSFLKMCIRDRFLWDLRFRLHFHWSNHCIKYCSPEDIAVPDPLHQWQTQESVFHLYNNPLRSSCSG